jgi:hypothetical protein
MTLGMPAKLETYLYVWGFDENIINSSPRARFGRGGGDSLSLSLSLSLSNKCAILPVFKGVK